MIQKLQDSRAVLLGAVAIFALGLTTSGYVLGDGLRRAKMAERSVTVRGVSERDVTADLATWTISFPMRERPLARCRRRSIRRAVPFVPSSSALDLSLTRSAMWASMRTQASIET